jgi:hypothetical protein
VALEPMLIMLPPSPHMPHGRLSGQQQSEDVNVEHPVELLFSKTIDCSELIDAGIVNKYIDPAIVLHRGLDYAFRFGAFGEVTANRDGPPRRS